MGPDIMIPREIAEEWGCSEKRVGNMIYRCTLRHVRLGGKLLRISDPPWRKQNAR